MLGDILSNSQDHKMDNRIDFQHDSFQFNGVESTESLASINECWRTWRPRPRGHGRVCPAPTTRAGPGPAPRASRASPAARGDSRSRPWAWRGSPRWSAPSWPSPPRLSQRIPTRVLKKEKCLYLIESGYNLSLKLCSLFELQCWYLTLCQLVNG